MLLHRPLFVEIRTLFSIFGNVNRPACRRLAKVQAQMSYSMPNGHSDGFFSYHSQRSSLGCNSPKKRRLEECLTSQKENKLMQYARSRETFLRVPGCNDVFHSEDYKTGSHQSTLYLPVHYDLLINLSNIEQISLSSGVSFLADDEGIYCRSAQGNAINLWRFDNNTRKLYISRALFFTDPEIYWLVHKQLDEI